MARIKHSRDAGLKSKRGRPPIGPIPSKADLVRLYVKEGRSIREIGEVLKCSKDMVYRALNTHKIQRRSKGQRKLKLKNYGISFIKRQVKKKGQVTVAEELGVNQSTLSRYLRKTEVNK